jgi:hypothetical protein
METAITADAIQNSEDNVTQNIILRVLLMGGT